MKTLSIISASQFEQNGVQKVALKTAEGTVFTQLDYLNKKVKALGLILSAFLGNLTAYVVVMEKPIVRKEGVAFKYTKADSTEGESTPKSTYIEGGFDIQLSQAGSLNAMIAGSIAERFAMSMGLTLNNNVSAPVADKVDNKQEENIENVLETEIPQNVIVK
jgi:hypothetical protein